MAGNFDIKKYSPAELVLLGLFILGLFLSYLIVSVRSRIELSEPFKLDFSNFSVSVPTGEGWQGSQGWQYQTDNYFSLASVFNVAGRVNAVVQCRYFLAAESLSPEQHLEAGIRKAGAKVLERGQLRGELEVYWAKVETAELGNIVFFGYGVLPGQRLLEVEAIAFVDPKLAEAAFMAVVESIEVFEDTRQETAERFIEHLRTIGAPELVAAEVGASSRRVYVTAKGEEVEGFMVDLIRQLDRGHGGEVTRIQRLHYTSNDMVSGNCIIEFNDRFDEFIWDSRHSRKGVQSISHVHTTLYKQGNMVAKSPGSGKQKTSWPSRRLLPEALLEPAAKAFLDFSDDEVVFDVIFSRGIVVPARISKMELTEVKGKRGEAAYGVQIDFLHQAERYQQLYFDADKKILGKLERRQIFVMWDRVDIETLEERFPDWRKEVEKVQEEAKADV
jgi:hypothetical protein